MGTPEFKRFCDAKRRPGFYSYRTDGMDDAHGGIVVYWWNPIKKWIQAAAAKMMVAVTQLTSQYP